MKTLLKYLLLLFLLFGTLAGVLFAGLGYLVSWPASAPQKADVLVVLGGDDGLRVRKGAELYRNGYASHIILTGIDARYYRRSHPNWRERRMMEAGIPRRVLKVDTRSATTWEEAVNTAETMDRNGWKRAIVVSDPPHMLRLRHTWSKAFEGSSRSFVLVATKPSWWHPLFWWQDPLCYRFVISEVKKNLFYSIMYY